MTAADGSPDAEAVPPAPVAKNWPHNSARLFFADATIGRLSESNLKKWEEFLMSTAEGRRFNIELWNEIDTLAEARGKAQSVLDVLEDRDLQVPATISEQILGSTDTDQLRVWLRRAITVATADAVLQD